MCGGVGGMMVIELLAGTMRLDRISPEAVGRAAKRALCGVRNCRGGNERMEDWIIFLHGVGVLCATHLCC